MMSSARLVICSAVLAVAALAAGEAAHAQTDPVERLQEAISSGDARVMMERAGERVEVALLSSGSVYSRDQAVYVMERFFEEHPPDRVSLNPTAEAEKSQFVEGTYQTRGQTLLLYLRLYHQDGQWQLHEVRLRRGAE